MPETWRHRQWRAMDYHPGRTRHDGDYTYYDPWRRQKIDETSARSRAEATRVIRDDCVHRDEDVERKLRDESVDYHPAFGWPHGQFSNWITRAGQANVEVGHGVAPGSLSGVLTSADDTAAVSHLLQDARVITNENNLMTLSEMRAYAHGRMMR